MEMAANKEQRPEWMTSISATVKSEDYLLGRKVDKTFELSQQEKLDKARETRIDLIANNRITLEHDPIIDLERRRHELKMELIRNPVKLKQFRDKLLMLEHDQTKQHGDKIIVRGESTDAQSRRGHVKHEDRHHTSEDSKYIRRERSNSRDRLAQSHKSRGRDEHRHRDRPRAHSNYHRSSRDASHTYSRHHRDSSRRSSEQLQKSRSIRRSRSKSPHRTRKRESKRSS